VNGSETGSGHASLPLPDRRGRCELAVVLALGLALGLACRGHFVKPHGDFYEFREVGRALLRGELPPTFKRAPVYPLLVASLGSVVQVVAETERPPDQWAAELLNALLLPLGAGLCWLLARGWAGRQAGWVAWWWVLLPVGLYCTAHTLAEPTLVAAVLATLVLTQRGSRWAYLLAAVATMTRYDAAGLLLGVAAADLLRGGRWPRVLARAALAAAPLLAWLTLTAWTWEQRSADHYLRQIAQARSVDLRWPVKVSARMVFDRDAPALPVWAAELEPWLAGGMAAALWAATATGAAWLLVRRRSETAAVGALLLGYWAVHAVFPFRAGFERFGYPPAAVLLPLAGVGAGLLGARAVRWKLGLSAAPLSVAGGAVGMLWAGAETERLWAMWRLGRFADSPLPTIALTGTVAAWLVISWGWWRVRPRAIAGLLAATMLAGMLGLAAMQTRLAWQRIGGGDERINDVLAACWIRDHTRPDEGVLCDAPGLLRLYVPDRDPRLIVGLGQIAAENWPEILDECRARQVRYIIWHDQVFAEQGAYYIAKWRLERFALLSQPEQVPGVEVAAHFGGRTSLWILRIK